MGCYSTIQCISCFHMDANAYLLRQHDMCYPHAYPFPSFCLLRPAVLYKAHQVSKWAHCKPWVPFPCCWSVEWCHRGETRLTLHVSSSLQARNCEQYYCCYRELSAAMKGADAVICAIGSSGFNPKGPKTVDYEVGRCQFVAAMMVCLLCFLMHWLPDVNQPHILCAQSCCHLACNNTYRM